MFCEDGLQGKDRARAFFGIAVEFGEREVFVEISVIEFGPVDQIEVFLRLEERENLDTHWSEDDVGVAGAMERDSGEEPGQDEERKRHPPTEIRVAHKPGDGDKKGKGEGHGGPNKHALGLSGPGEAEFLVRFGDCLWGGHVEWDSLVWKQFRVWGNPVCLSLDVDDLAVVEFRGRTGFFFGLRREAGGDDLDFSLKAFGKGSSDEGPDRWDEEEKADGVGEKAGGQEDRSGDENHETVERFIVGHASFAGGLLEFRHGEAALGFGQGSADDRSDNDDCDGVWKPKLGAQGHEEVELGQGDEDEEKEEFSKHDGWNRIMRVAGISTTISS